MEAQPADEAEWQHLHLRPCHLRHEGERDKLIGVCFGLHLLNSSMFLFQQARSGQHKPDSTCRLSEPDDGNLMVESEPPLQPSFCQILATEECNRKR